MKLTLFFTLVAMLIVDCIGILMNVSPIELFEGVAVSGGICFSINAVVDFLNFVERSL